jgi:hypothetical protein
VDLKNQINSIIDLIRSVKYLPEFQQEFIDLYTNEDLFSLMTTIKQTIMERNSNDD